VGNRYVRVARVSFSATCVDHCALSRSFPCPCTKFCICGKAPATDLRKTPALASLTGKLGKLIHFTLVNTPTFERLYDFSVCWTLP